MQHQNLALSHGNFRYPMPGLNGGSFSFFSCRAGKTEHHVKQEARALATLLMPPTIERLIASEIDGFLVLVPERPCVEVDALAAKCVRSFDHLRAAPDAEEVARRLATGLTPRQSQYFADWGIHMFLRNFVFI